MALPEWLSGGRLILMNNYRRNKGLYLQKYLAKIMDSAGHDNNSCLRAYYFALSVVCWLSGVVPFLIASTLTVLVLYNREFKSSAVLGIQGTIIPPPTS